MGNLLRIVLALTEDQDARRALRRDPDAVLGGVDGLCTEDVVAVLDVVRHQVAPELSDRLTGVMAQRPGGDHDPEEGARLTLLALCDAVEGAAPAVGSRDVPPGPPGGDRSPHLWAIDGSGDTAVGSGDEDFFDPDPGDAPPRTTPLAPVPDPPGGFEFSPLELVQLPAGLPDVGIEPGALATVVAVHRDPELHYEIEVSGGDGGRRFLGTVPPSSLDRYTG